MYFSFPLLYSSSMIGSFLKFSLSASILLSRPVSMFTYLFHFVIFLKFCLVLFFQAYSSVLFCLCCSYGLGERIISPTLEGMALSRNISWVVCVYLVILAGWRSGECRPGCSGASREWSNKFSSGCWTVAPLAGKLKVEGYEWGSSRWAPAGANLKALLGKECLWLQFPGEPRLRSH